MELRRVADALLRCHTSPLSPNLSTRTNAITSRANSRRPVERTFTSSSRRSFRLPPPTTTSAASEPDAKKSEAFGEFKDMWSKTITSQKFRSNASSNEKRLNGGYSDSQMLSTISQEKRMALSSKDYDIDKMITPKSDFEKSMSPNKKVDESLQIPPAMRLTASTGRTVSVTPGVDVGRAFSLLSQSCARNGVRRDFASQRFHERPGLKRKRLRRVRWRKSFREGFKAVVARVTKLRNQGW